MEWRWDCQPAGPMPVTDHFDWEQRLHGRVLDFIDVLYQIVMKELSLQVYSF